MKSVSYIVLLSLVVLLLSSCVGLPPVFPEQASPRRPQEPAGAVAMITVEVPAAAAQATPAGESAPIAAPAATAALATPAPVETAVTPTEEQVMRANPLVGVVWEWAALLKTQPALQSAVPDPASYTLIFADDGNLVIKADCNNATGTYTLVNDQLVITVGAVTEVACPAGSLGDQMLKSLGQVGSYLIDGGDLILRLADTGDSMLFRNAGASAVPAAPPVTEVPAAVAPPQTPTAPAATTARAGTLIGPTWQWERFVDVATGKSTIEVKNPADYTATFKKDGSVDMKADCNRAAGTYTADGAKLTINVGPITLAACGPGSLGEEFLIGLTSATGYSIEGGKLIVELMADGGRMVFGAAK